MKNFFDIKEIESKAKKLYESSELFRAYIREEKIFPYTIKLKKVTQTDIQKQYEQILAQSVALKNSALHVVYKEYNFKSIGVQKLPIEVLFNSTDELLKFINKKVEFKRVVQSYEKMVSTCRALKELIYMKPQVVTQNLERVTQLLNVCKYFLQNPKPYMYIRELAIEDVDTKFIQNNRTTIDLMLSAILNQDEYDVAITTFSNYGFEKKYSLKYPLPIVRFRLLDDDLLIANMSDISLTIKEFEKLELKCKRIFIVENKITALSFPKTENSMIIFGSGYNVGILKNCRNLEDKEIFYWGDIDTDGFAILSQVRGYFKQIKSILMSEDIVEKFSKYGVKEGKKSVKTLTNLTTNEQSLYLKLQNNDFGENFRLEQERIPYLYLLNTLDELDN